MKRAVSTKHLAMLILLKICLFLPLGSVCLAGGGQHYPNGFTDFVVGAVPPPGTYLEDELFYIRKDRLTDNAGDRLPIDFSADVVINGARLIHITPYTLFGASFGVQTIIPLYHAETEISSGASSLDAEETGLGDIVLTPLLLGWHFGPNLHVAAAVDLIAPTGDYDNRNPASQILSRNHWTIEPLAAVTYLWRGFDLSAKLMYDVHSKNREFLDPATGREVTLEPGQEFHADWAIGYAPKEGIRFGLVGFNHWQTTDDEIAGARVSDQKSRLGGIGAGFKYWPRRGRYSITIKHYWEYGARNIAEGQSSMLKLNCRF